MKLKIYVYFELLMFVKIPFMCETIEIKVHRSFNFSHSSWILENSVRVCILYASILFYSQHTEFSGIFIDFNSPYVNVNVLYAFRKKTHNLKFWISNQSIRFGWMNKSTVYILHSTPIQGFVFSIFITSILLHTKPNPFN